MVLLRRAVIAPIIAALALFATPAYAQGGDAWFGRDKALHFAVGAGIAGAGYAGTTLLNRDRKLRIVVGLTFGVGASAAKEWKDRRGTGDPSWKDFTMGALGSLAGSTVAWLIDRGTYDLTPLRAPAETRAGLPSPVP
jgi:putative lipoprotein